MSFSHFDAAVVGAGPNGLAAAIAMARHGLKVALIEARQEVGGGLRSGESTLPGFVHDLCSAVYPMAIASPFFSSLPLANYGLRWKYSPAALAHPMDDGSCGLLWPDLEKTARQFGTDADTYRRMFQPAVEGWNDLKLDLLAPPGLPRNPLLMARFGLAGIRPAAGFLARRLRTELAGGFFAGMAAHSALPLTSAGSAAFGLALGAAGHTGGWPIAEGGSGTVALAMARYFQALNGRIFTGFRVENLDDLGAPRAILCDVTPAQLVTMAGRRLPDEFRRAFRAFRRGPGAFKLDWALAGPVPWKSEECRLAATVHLGGSADEIAASEAGAWSCQMTGQTAARPFVLLVQPALFDRSRAPEGCHTVWAYCHVPNGSTADMSVAIENQIERFAPGFRERILARRITAPRDFEQRNENYLGGDILGGAQTLRQMMLRPTRHRYGTGIRGLYLCSASTPPGGGVHGMCGYFAARRALREVFGMDSDAPEVSPRTPDREAREEKSAVVF